MSKGRDRLIARFDSLPLETEIDLPEVMRLGGGAYSRRFEEVREHYLPLGFVIVNRTERHPDATHSFYRKGKASDHPDELSAAVAAHERRKAKKNRAVGRPASDRLERIARFEREFGPAARPSTKQPEPEFQLTP
jgi:hypothetical protein